MKYVFIVGIMPGKSRSILDILEERKDRRSRGLQQ